MNTMAEDLTTQQHPASGRVRPDQAWGILSLIGTTISVTLLFSAGLDSMQHRLIIGALAVAWIVYAVLWVGQSIMRRLDLLGEQVAKRAWESGYLAASRGESNDGTVVPIRPAL